MKLIEWIDDDGYKHLSWIEDGDDPEEGLPHDPPDINSLDWFSIKREIHNRLVEMRLVDYSEIVKHQTAITSITTAVIKRHLVALYRSVEKEEKDE